MFWIGQLTIFVPITYRLLTIRASRRLTDSSGPETIASPVRTDEKVSG